MTGNKNAWRAPLAGLASVAMIATMGVAAGTANAAAPEFKVSFDLAGRGNNFEVKATESNGYKLVSTNGYKSPADVTAAYTPSQTNDWVNTGWYTADGEKFNVGDQITGDITLKAHWAKGSDVKTVSFTGTGYLAFADTNQDLTSSTADQRIKLAPGDTLADWEKPVDKDLKDGRKLVGFKTKDGKADYDFSKAPTAKNEQIKSDLPASQWVSLEKGGDLGSASFGVSGNETVLEVADGESFALPTAAYRQGDGVLRLVTNWKYNEADPAAATGATTPWAGDIVPDTADGKRVDHLRLAASADEGDVEAVKVQYSVAGGPEQSFEGKNYFIAKGDGVDTSALNVNTSGDLYSLNGWYTDAALTNAYYGDALEADTTLYAALNLNGQTVTATFEPDFTGAEPTVVKVAKGGAIEWQDAPARDGYVFQAWKDGYTNIGFLYSAKDFADKLSVVNYDHTLTAQWLTVAQDQLKQLVNLGDKEAYTADSWDAYDKAVKDVLKDANIANNDKSDFQKYAKLGEKAVAAWVQTLTNAKAKLVPVNASAFNDVFTSGNATPHNADIDYMARKGIVGGFSDGTFRPLSTMKRQDFAAFLYRLAGSPEYTPAAADDIFSDVDASTPHYKEILWASSKGIVKGFADGTFRGMSLVNRQDAAAFFYRLAGSPEFDASKAAKQFADVDPAGTANHEKEVLWAANTVVSIDYDEDGFDASDYAGSIVQGFPNNTFAGTATLLRQDGAAFIARMYAYLNK